MDDASTLQLDDVLKAKIVRRARRAWRAFDKGLSKRATRCSDVTATTLRYRIPHAVAGTTGGYSGPRVLVQRERRRRWWAPWTFRDDIIIVSDDTIVIAND